MPSRTEGTPATTLTSARAKEAEPITLEAHTRRFEPESAPATPALARTEVAAASGPREVDVEPAPLEERGLDGRYDVRSLLGEGGMGEVRLCKDRRIGREVAMKVVRAGHGSKGEVRARFEREARVQGQLEHPSVVPVYDLGIGADGQAYFTMKRVRGLTLEDIIAKLREGDPETASAYSRRKLLTALGSVCLAIEFAHARGVLHRDLKPGNIMLGDYGEVHILDWGLAKIAGAEDLPPGDRIEAPSVADHRTAEGEIMGTPGYMAPEQVRCEALDGRADVYALGAILFEVLTFESLHARTTTTALLASTVKGVEARPSVRAPARAVPPELEAICVRATALEPRDRFETARDMHTALERYLDGDRDLERRREMADAHALAAGVLATRSREEGSDARAARDEAMREAGSALALDPAHPGALGTLVSLLLDAPSHMPAEARAEFDSSSRTVERAAQRGTFVVFGSWFLFMPMVLFLGVRSYATLGVFAGVLTLAVGAAYFASRGIIQNRLGFFAYVLGSIVIALATQHVGPFILAPGMAAANTLGYFIYGNRAYRKPALAIGVMTILGPWLLEITGVLSPSYAFANGVMTVLPRAVELPQMGTNLFLLLATLALVAGPAIMMGRVRDKVAAAEERLFLHAWNLRQLVPHAARGAAVVPRDAADALPKMCHVEKHFVRNREA